MKVRGCHGSCSFLTLDATLSPSDHARRRGREKALPTTTLAGVVHGTPVLTRSLHLVVHMCAHHPILHASIHSGIHLTLCTLRAGTNTNIKELGILPQISTAPLTAQGTCDRRPSRQKRTLTCDVRIPLKSIRTAPAGAHGNIRRVPMTSAVIPHRPPRAEDPGPFTTLTLRLLYSGLPPGRTVSVRQESGNV